MHRHLTSLASFAAVLAVALTGCASVPEDAAEPTTTDAVRGATEERTSSTAVEPGTIPVVSRPATVTKIDAADLPERVQAIRWVPEAGEPERDCVHAIVYEQTEEDPGLASVDRQLAGLTGAAAVACLPQEAIEAFVADRLAERADDGQLACVQEQLVMADPQAKATFVGGVVLDQPAVIAAVAPAVDVSCGTNLAAD